MKRSRGFWIFALGVLVGVVLALVIAPFWVPGIAEPYVVWFEAVGTWVGGLGTVIAVGVAVYVFGVERHLAERESAEKERIAKRQRLEKATERQERELERARDATHAASLVAAKFRPETAGGGPLQLTLDSLRVAVTNDSRSVVTVTRVRADPPYDLGPLRDGGIRVEAESSGGSTRSINQQAISREDFERADGLPGLFEYKLDGKVWTRRTEDDSTPQLGTIEDRDQLEEAGSDATP